MGHVYISLYVLILPGARILSRKPFEREQNGRKFGIPWGYFAYSVHVGPVFEKFHFGGHFGNLQISETVLNIL